MSLRVVRSALARADVLDHASYIAENAGLDAADRFLQAIEHAYAQLAQLPGMGSPRDYGDPALTGMRMWPIPRYRNFLIFYRATGEEIEILRVLYAARDIQEIFAPTTDG